MKTNYKVIIFGCAVLLVAIILLNINKDKINGTLVYQNYNCGDCPQFRINKSNISKYNNIEVIAFYKGNNFEDVILRINDNAPKKLTISSKAFIVSGEISFDILKFKYVLNIENYNQK